MEFSPKIAALVCSRCAGNALKIAEVNRLDFPAGWGVISLPCAGKLDLLYILKAYEQGADGVLVVGCERCQYKTGTQRAEKKINYARSLLARIAFSPERLGYYQFCSSMGVKLAESFKEFKEKIQSLGPAF